MNPNSAYWKTREERQKRLYQISEEEYQAKVKDIYDNMVVSINKEVYGFYGKYAKTEGITIEEARQRVSKIDMAEYEAKAKKYVKERDFSDQANEELRLYNTSMKINRLELLKANIGLEMVDGFDQLQKEFDADLTERAYAELKRQAGILGKSVDNTAKTAGSIVNASFKNATFSDRIWMYQAMMKDRLSTLLTQGMVQGKSAMLLARDLTKAFGVSRSDAERLMRTELARVQIAAQEEAYKQNGYDFYEFIGGQADACPICSALDGKRFAVKDMMPGTNAPPMHPNCRCSTAAWVGKNLSKETIVHSLNVEDLDMLAEINEFDPKTQKLIREELLKHEKEKNFFISDIYVGRIPKTEDGTPALQIERQASGLLKLNINSDVFAGKSIDEINKRFKDSDISVVNSLQEAILHESNHAMLYYGLTNEETKELERLSNKINIEDISAVAYNNAVECLAEVEVLLSRGETVPDEALELFNAMKRGKDDLFERLRSMQT